MSSLLREQASSSFKHSMTFTQHNTFCSVVYKKRLLWPYQGTYSQSIKRELACGEGMVFLVPSLFKARMQKHIETQIFNLQSYACLPGSKSHRV